MPYVTADKKCSQCGGDASEGDPLKEFEAAGNVHYIHAFPYACMRSLATRLERAEQRILRLELRAPKELG
jgi:hypothetical protein